jgi:hypothetical protein
MTDETFSGTCVSDVTLTGVAYNPSTSTGTIGVAAGIARYGAAGTAWTITNQGTVENSGSGAGVRFASSGCASDAIGRRSEP